MPHELKGLIPSVDYYNKVYGARRWKASTIYSLGIGQGELGINPMQMANILCIIANKGYYYTPHVIKKIADKPNTSRNLAEKHYTKVNPQYFDIVQDGMVRVVEAGTARIAKFDTITICGKTGTAQNPHGKDHSLFVAFAPKDDPKIAIAVMVENAGFGATWAAPIASLMMEKYLRDSISRPALEERMLKGFLLPLQNKGPENSVLKPDTGRTAVVPMRLPGTVSKTGTTASLPAKKKNTKPAPPSPEAILPQRRMTRH